MSVETGTGPLGETYQAEEEPEQWRVENREVSVRTIGLHIPKDPVVINGEAYGLVVDEDRLGNSVGFVQRYYRRSRLTISDVAIELGDSLPPLLAVPPTDADKLRYNGRTSAVTVTVPREVVKTGTLNETLADQLRQAMNRELEIGLLQCIGANRSSNRFYKYWLAAAVSIGPVLGGTAGAVASHSAPRATRIEEAFVGTVFGAIAGMAGMVTHNIIVTGSSVDEIEKTYGTRPSRFADQQINQPRRILGKFFEERIISLVPVETGNEPQ